MKARRGEGGDRRLTEDLCTIDHLTTWHLHTFKLNLYKYLQRQRKKIRRSSKNYRYHHDILKWYWVWKVRLTTATGSKIDENSPESPPHRHAKIQLTLLKILPPKKSWAHFDLSPTQRTVKASEIAHHKLDIAPSILAEFVQTKKQTNRQYPGRSDGWWVWWCTAMKAALQRSELHRAKASRS
jgi:hypothetical protein